MPWDWERVLHLARVNQELILPSNCASESARAAPAAVIRPTYDEHDAHWQTVGGHAAAKKRRLFSATDLLEADRARIEAERAAADGEAVQANAKRRQSSKQRVTSLSLANSTHWRLVACVCHSYTVAARVGLLADVANVACAQCARERVL